MYHSASQGHWAYWGYRNPAFDSQLDRAEQTVDDNQRARLYRDAQKMLYDDQASIFVMQKPDIFVFRKGVKGLKYSVFWGLILSYYTMYKE
jgi:peptide/nickel transport system substrate-binding protein